MARSARLQVFLARDAPVAAVLRRGPSKQVLLSKWDLARDTFEHGQWLKGRIYEERCDLSPNGELFVYFAASHKPPMYSWTAVSRLPFLTALLLYPKGDCWGGGGLFVNDRRLDLNHRAGYETDLAEGFTLPKRFDVHGLGAHAGWGENDPIRHERLIRDGWVLVEPGKETRRGFGASPWIVYDPPRRYARPHRARSSLRLERLTTGIKERNGPWEIQEHRVIEGTERVVLDLGRTDWADWDYRGDLLFAKAGRLYRCAGPKRRGAEVLGEPALVADLRELRFRPLPPPAWATEWPGRRKGRRR